MPEMNELIEKQIAKAAECLLAADKVLHLGPTAYRLQVNACLGCLLEIIQNQQTQIEELKKSSHSHLMGSL